MGFLDKLFNLGKSEDKTTPAAPEAAGIRFGHYSDNNKSLSKTKQWYVAEDFYKEKNITACLEAFFDYLRDEQEDNVRFEKTDSGYRFEIFQGTKIVYGDISDTEVRASVSLARMEKPSIPVMRRLLEMNYMLYYSRFALQDDKLCMLFDTPKETASPSKLYYGLKELATKADKQDDLLITDFNTLQAVDDSHVTAFGEQEKEVKYTYFVKWLEDTLNQVEALNQDSFSGGIAYILLTLLYRIDFLITPEGKLLNELERINTIYWANKEEKTAVERNQMLKESLRKLQSWPKEEITRYFYRAKTTFAITVPKPYTEVVDNIRSSRENMQWYRENKYEGIAQRLLEYSLSYPQYSFSLPKPLTELFTLYMKINVPEFFYDLGLRDTYVREGVLQQADISAKIRSILGEFSDKYPHMNLDLGKLNFSTVLDFNVSLLTEMENLNFENNIPS